MKVMMISIKPKWCAKIMNGEKTIEVRKNKALASAIQKLIDEQGYADIYVYCSKSNYLGYISNRYVGKVVFKFRCYKVEEIDYTYLVNARSYFIQSCLTAHHFSKECCLEQWELDQYLNGKKGYAIHISDLEIFKPKELNEFRHWVSYKKCKKCPYEKYYGCNPCLEIEALTNAPQNFAYLEVE